MINFSKKNTVIITLIITIFISSVISVVWSNFFPKNDNTNVEILNQLEDTKEVSYTEDIQIAEEQPICLTDVWKIEIPKIIFKTVVTVFRAELVLVECSCRSSVLDIKKPPS